jgi:hypothetical protein
VNVPEIKIYIKKAFDDWQVIITDYQDILTLYKKVEGIMSIFNEWRGYDILQRRKK